MSIKFCSLSSGSSGNCQYIETENTRIIIDAGFSGKRIESLLKNIDVEPSSIDGILVTHEHIDHVHGVGVLSRRYDIPIYANDKTWEGMNPLIKAIKDKNTKIFDSDKMFAIDDIDILPISISHDSLAPVGYILYHNKVKLSIVTDIGWVNNNVKNLIKNSNLYFLESNHDEKMLREGPYPIYLKKRILSNKGHLSNNDAGELLGEVLSGSGEVVILAHLSKDNNTPQIAYDTVRRCIMEQGLNVDTDMRLELSFRDKSTPIFSY